MPPVGLDNLEHIVVVMMENRSCDHMLGGLSLVMENGAKKYPLINGLTGNESKSGHERYDGSSAAEREIPGPVGS